MKEKEIREQEALLAFEKKKTEIKKNLERQKKKLLKGKETFEKQLKECLLWEKKKHEAELLKAHFPQLKKGVSSIVVLDWENENKEIILEVDPKLEPKDQIAQLFKKAKKLKAGIFHQEKQIALTAKKMEDVLKELAHLETFKSLEELKKAYPVKTKEKPLKQLPYRAFVSESGFKILVGKNSRGNDALTFHYAKGNDLWMHVRDYPGSHVVIVRPKGVTIDPATINFAAELCCRYSKAKGQSRVEICLTEKKYVTRLGKNKDGKVQISKHSSLFLTDK